MNNQQHQQIIEMFSSLADDVGDILFELETSGTLTQDQTEIISTELDQIFKKHLEQILDSEDSKT